MLTFKQFLSEDRRVARTEVVSVEAFIRWADANASLYMHGPHFLYRGGSGDAKKGLRLGDASSAGVTPRESANTHNNYTLWIDNHPSFKGWPKRSRSFIGTDDIDIAMGFGGAALLVVHDEASVGIVGEQDMWNTPLKMGELTIEELNGITAGIINTNAQTYEQLVTALKAADIEAVKKELNDGWAGATGMIGTMEKRKLNNLFELWESLVKPSIFKGHVMGHAVGDKAVDGEVWIQGQVGFIPHVSRLSEAEANRLVEWADQYPELLEAIENLWGGDHEDQWGDE